MNIILQNYKNFINDLIKTYFTDKIDNIINNFDESRSINNYINLLSSFDYNMSKFMCNALINILEELDKNYCKPLERKRIKRFILFVFFGVYYLISKRYYNLILFFYIISFSKIYCTCAVFTFFSKYSINFLSIQFTLKNIKP